MDSTKWGRAAVQRFPAGTVGGFPNYDHRFSHGLIVDAPASCPSLRVLTIVKLAEQPDAVLAMMSGNRDELVQEAALVLLGIAPLTVSQCYQ